MYTWLTFATAADLAQLTKEITPEYSPNEIVQKLTGSLSGAVKGILIERSYIDKDYRSTYYNFYAKKGQHYRADCVRLHFFDGSVTFDQKALKLTWPDRRLEDHYFGYVVLRPTEIATIGRSVVSPDVRTGAHGHVITTHHKVHLLGYKLSLEGFPSMDQHIDISVCAHAACWSILRHYSVRYPIYREFLTYDITLMAQRSTRVALFHQRGWKFRTRNAFFNRQAPFPLS